MAANTTASRKNKGRTFQKWVVERLIALLGISPEDIESRSMGAGGEDILLAAAAREKFPFSIECKNQERVNIWEAYEQAQANAKQYSPIVFIKRNRSKPLVVLDAETFINLVGERQ